MRLGLPVSHHLTPHEEKYAYRHQEYEESWSYEMLTRPIATSENVMLIPSLQNGLISC